MNPTDGSGLVSPPSSVSAGLSPQQVEQITRAYRRAGPVRRAMGVANFNGWTMAIAAVLTGGVEVVSAVATVSTGGLKAANLSLWGVLLGAGLGVLAWNELAGAAGLRRLDLKAPRRLALNQIILGVLLALYAIWQLVATLRGGGPLAQGLAGDAELADAMASYQGMARSLTIMFYEGLLVFAIICQGAMALYYYTRTSALRSYVEETPDWVRKLQQAGAVKF